ncbi:MAG: hypothetical protein KA791_01675 [Flavobacteriales bacterium]|nr:hypothetical protein [Flavobacteriales bacterium]
MTKLRQMTSNSIRPTLLLLLAIGVSPLSAQEVLERAIVVPANVDSLIASESRFAAADSVPPPKGKTWFAYSPGKGDILFVAGHATTQMREGRMKQPDSGTGSLAVVLNQLRDVPVLYTTYLAPSDPNFYDDNAFKDSLAHILEIMKPKLVIDLHASHPYRPYDVDFGTMNGTSYLERRDLWALLTHYLSNEGLERQSWDFFPAAKNATITKFVHAKGVPCIQLEINAGWVSAGIDDLHAQRSAQLLQALLRFIDAADGK